MTSILDSIGNTPLLLLPSLSKYYGLKIYGKAEYLNPGGSVKDRASLNMIKRAEKNGTLKTSSDKRQTVIEGTGGKSILRYFRFTTSSVPITFS